MSMYEMNRILTEKDLNNIIKTKHQFTIDSSSTLTVEDIWNSVRGGDTSNGSSGSAVIYLAFNERSATFICDFLAASSFRAVCIENLNQFGSTSPSALRVGDILEHSGDGTETLYQAFLNLINAETEKDNIFESKTKVMRFI